MSLKTESSTFFVFITVFLVLAVGIIDYLTSPEISIAIFYLVSLVIASWYVGIGFGYFTSFLCILVSLTGDVASGFQHSNLFIPFWDAFIVLGFYLIVATLLGRLRTLTRGLQAKVSERTVALTREKEKRQTLERELLEISEREQRRIGQDLHDSLCQHLTGISLSVKVLEERLTKKNISEGIELQRVLKLMEEGINLSRKLARGLYPVEMSAEGLMEALDELAVSSSELFKISCRFKCDAPVLIDEPDVSGHLYRISQEAVSNSVKHGKARNILIELSMQEYGLMLTVSDDGTGLSDKTLKSGGMGLRIMEHRAHVIGAEFSARPGPEGGTVVSCSWPDPVIVGEAA